MATLDTLHRRILEETLKDRTLLLETVESSSSGTNAVIAQAENSSKSANAHDGEWLYFPETTSGIKETQVARAGFSGATGAFTLDPDLGSTPQAGDDVYFTGPLRMRDVDNAINKILRSLYLDRYGVLSLSADPNMEDSGTSAYTALESASLSKVTAQAQVYTGRQALQVTSSATLGSGVRTESPIDTGLIDMAEGETFYISAIVNLSSGKWETVLQDTSGTEIGDSVVIPSGSIATPDSKWWEVRFHVPNTATGNSGISVAFKTTQTGVQVLNVDSVSLLSDSRPIVKLPDEIADTSDIEGVYRMPQGLQSEYADVYVPFGRSFRDWPFEPLRDFTAVHKNRIDIGRCFNGDPLWVKYKAANSTLAQDAGDTETTEAPEDLIVHGAVADLQERLAARLPKGSEEYNDRKREAARSRRRYHGLLEAYGLGKPESRDDLVKVYM